MTIIKKEQVFEAIRQISSQNLLNEEEIKTIISDAVKKSFHTKYDPDADLELIIDEKKDLFKLFNNSKLVVCDDDFNQVDNAIEIPLSQAQKNNKKSKEGDFISEEVDFSLYSKQIAQQIRQIFTQTIREKKKEVVYSKHKGLKGEVIDVVVTLATSTYAIFKLDDGANAFMPAQLRNPNIPLPVGKRVKVYVENILEDSKDAQIIVSNGSKQVVKKVLEEEVPEIISGIVEIVTISRQPGIRSKVAVKSTNENIDPVGAIIGSKGTRINAIVSKLKGEKIDIILFSNDINQYVANALSPARVASVIDKKNDSGEIIEGHKTVIVPNRHQTLAIGKLGSNVRLAVEIVSQRIDVLSIDQAKEAQIEFELNVGLTQSDIENIENGNVVGRKKFSSEFSDSQQLFKNSDFDNSIENFTNEIKEENITKNFDVDDDLFSEEQLKQMEEEFEFDPKLKEFENSENEQSEF